MKRMLHKNIVILIAAFCFSLTACVTSPTKSNVSFPREVLDNVDDWASGAVHTTKAVHSQTIISYIQSEELLDEKRSWIYNELKNMYEEGILRRFSIKINSNLQKEMNIPSGNYYYIPEHVQSLIKVIDWDIVVKKLIPVAAEQDG